MPNTCGPNADENCCTSLVVPGGTYYRSYDGIDYTDMSYPATVSTFALDRFEVTVGRFRAFVDAGMGTRANPPSAGDGAHPLIANSGWDSSWSTELPEDTHLLRVALSCDVSLQTWTHTVGANETLPINCVDWYEAFAFCAWDGGRLPTEAEWNYAAAGGSEQRYYPWSSAYPPGSTGIDPTYTVYDCMGDGVVGCAATDIQRVGSRSPKGDGRWGQADIGGNIWEWILDLQGAYPIPCSDCAELTLASYRGLRGGYFLDGASPVRVALRGESIPGLRHYSAGLRCARLP